MFENKEYYDKGMQKGQKGDNETHTVDFASRGYWAREVIKDFLGDEKYNNLFNAAKNDPKLTIDVTFKEGEIVDLRYC